MDLKQYFFTYFDNLENNFHSSYLAIKNDENYSLKTVHDLRIALKKEFAFLNFLQAIDAAFPAKKCRLILTGIHKASGKVRNLEVEEKLLQEIEAALDADHEISSKLNTDITFGKKILRNYEYYHPGKLFQEVGEIVHHHINGLKVDNLNLLIKKYFKQLISKIKNGIKKERPDLHKTRMDIKELYYNLQMIVKSQNEQTDPIVKTSLSLLQDELGKFHDIVMTLKELDKRRIVQEEIQSELKKARNSEKEKIHDLIENIDLIFDRVNDQLNNLFTILNKP